MLSEEHSFDPAKKTNLLVWRVTEAVYWIDIGIVASGTKPFTLRAKLMHPFVS